MRRRLRARRARTAGRARLPWARRQRRSDRIVIGSRKRSISRGCSRRQEARSRPPSPSRRPVCTWDVAEGTRPFGGQAFAGVRDAAQVGRGHAVGATLGRATASGRRLAELARSSATPARAEERRLDAGRRAAGHAVSTSVGVHAAVSSAAGMSPSAGGAVGGVAEEANGAIDGAVCRSGRTGGTGEGRGPAGGQTGPRGCAIRCAHRGRRHACSLGKA